MFVKTDLMTFVMNHDVPSSGTLDKISYCWRCGAAFNDAGPCPGRRDMPLPRFYTVRDRNNDVVVGLEQVPADNGNLLLLMARGARLPDDGQPVSVFVDSKDKVEYRIVLEPCRWVVINTWNGGAGGRVVGFVSSVEGDAGHNECFEWIHMNTPYEAVTHQGYKIEPWFGGDT